MIANPVMGGKSGGSDYTSFVVETALDYKDYRYIEVEYVGLNGSKEQEQVTPSSGRVVCQKNSVSVIRAGVLNIGGDEPPKLGTSATKVLIKDGVLRLEYVEV